MSSELIEIMMPALCAGIMVALTHAPLGIEVLKRGIIFIDLAIAQIAGLGLVFAGTMWHEPLWWYIQASALCFALCAAIFFRWVEKRFPIQQEAIIGCSFVVSASTALLLLADHPHGGEEIQHLLSGQILFVSWEDVLGHLPIYTAILASWFFIPKVRNGVWFYTLFAVAITSSVQLVGVYVVFASLIIPALAALNSKKPYLTAWLCGFLSVVTGITFSAYTDLPAGSVMVISYVVIALGVKVLRKLFYYKDIDEKQIL